jgi:hypothetical protein
MIAAIWSAAIAVYPLIARSVPWRLHRMSGKLGASYAAYAVLCATTVPTSV